MQKKHYIRKWIRKGLNEQDARALSQEIKGKWDKHIEECYVCTLDDDCPEMVDWIAQFSALNAYRTYLYLEKSRSRSPKGA